MPMPNLSTTPIERCVNVGLFEVVSHSVCVVQCRGDDHAVHEIVRLVSKPAVRVEGDVQILLAGLIVLSDPPGILAGAAVCPTWNTG